MLHVFVLHEFENDIALRRIRVELRIPFAIVFLYQNSRVFALGHIKIVVGACHSESICFCSVCYAAFSKCICMYRDEQVCFCTVCNVCTLLKVYGYVFFACINNFYVRTIRLNQSAEFKGHVEVYVFFLGVGAYRPRVVPAMPCIYNEGKCFVIAGSIGSRYRQQCNRQVYKQAF